MTEQQIKSLATTIAASVQTLVYVRAKDSGAHNWLETENKYIQWLENEIRDAIAGAGRVEE